MTDNMDYWKKMARPPTSALKPIKGGRLSGMSNISPQWRWQIMTEQFGMIGFGWKYTVEKKWTSPGANEEQFAFTEILLYVKVNGEWSDAIPGEGGSMLVEKESKGMHNNDEAFKMAVTDALGTAMAKLGVGADIYLGTFDGAKYNRPSEFPKQINTPQEAKKAAHSPEDSIDQHFPPPVPDETHGTLVVTIGETTGEKSLTKKELLKSMATIKIIAAKSGKKDTEVGKFIALLLDEEAYTITQIVEMLNKEN